MMTTRGQRGLFVAMLGVAGGLIFGVSGCAFTIDTIPLTYGRQPSVPMVKMRRSTTR
jgi:hypothetical protein